MPQGGTGTAPGAMEGSCPVVAPALHREALGALPSVVPALCPEVMSPPHG